MMLWQFLRDFCDTAALGRVKIDKVTCLLCVCICDGALKMEKLASLEATLV